MEEKNNIDRRLNILSQEKNIIGLYLSGHPIKEFESELRDMSIPDIHSYHDNFYTSGTTNQSLENVTICGVIIGIRQQRMGHDKSIHIITIDDSSARIQVIVYSETYLKFRNLITENQILFFNIRTRS